MNPDEEISDQGWLSSLRIYLDTSVISAYFDERTPDRQKATENFWTAAVVGKGAQEILISDLVLTELEQTPSDKKRLKMLTLVDQLRSLKVDKETLRLARVLHAAELVPQNKFDDAIHLALAAVTGVDAVVSWNFRHLVNLQVKRKLPVILAEERYLRHYDIISPYEFPED